MLKKIALKPKGKMKKDFYNICNTRESGFNKKNLTRF